MGSRISLLTLAVMAVTVAAQAQPHVAGCAVFPANNVWNAPVDKLPVDPNSDRYVAMIGATRPAHPDFGSGLWDGGPIGIPFIEVPGTQPKVTVTFDYDSESDHAGYPVPPNAPIEGGAASIGDRHVLVVDRDHCVLYELYAAYPQSNGSWHAGSGAIFDLKSNALRPVTWTSADAAGLPIFPGLLRYDEVAAGEIQHAVRFTAPQTRNTYIWPARHQAAGLTAVNFPPMGQRFRLKAGFDISGFSAPVQVILRGLKKYGMILADNGSSWYIGGAPDDRWDNDALHQITQLGGSDFEAVDESSLMMQPDSAAVRSAVAPAVSAVVNAGSFAPGAIAPGEILTIFGSGFDADAKVTFDGTAGMVIYASPGQINLGQINLGQINVVAPYEIAGQASTSMTVLIDGVPTTPQTLSVAAARARHFHRAESGLQRQLSRATSCGGFGTRALRHRRRANQTGGCGWQGGKWRSGEFAQAAAAGFGHGRRKNRASNVCRRRAWVHRRPHADQFAITGGYRFRSVAARPQHRRFYYDCDGNHSVTEINSTPPLTAKTFQRRGAETLRNQPFFRSGWCQQLHQLREASGCRNL